MTEEELKLVKLVEGKKVKGTDGKIGTVYKLYYQDKETFVAIEYSKNDFGMFKLADITIL